jgi:hypothetical protein
MQHIDERCRCGAFLVGKLPEPLAFFMIGAFRASHMGGEHGACEAGSHVAVFATAAKQAAAEMESQAE